MICGENPGLYKKKLNCVIPPRAILKIVLGPNTNFVVGIAPRQELGPRGGPILPQKPEFNMGPSRFFIH